MLRKSKVESSNVIIEAANHGNVDVLSLVLKKYTEQKVFQEGLKRLLTTESKSKFNALAEDIRLNLLKMVLEKIDYVDATNLEAAFTLELKQIITEMTNKPFDAGFALYATVKKIKDPSHNYIRAICGDNSPIDYYWYQLVDHILTKIPPEEALDNSIAHALTNGKVDILESLLKYIPQQAPCTNRQLSEIIKCQYTEMLMLERAICTGNTFLTQLLVSEDMKIKVTHFRQALGLRKNKEQILDILINAKNISLDSALRDSIHYRCPYAIRNILPKFEKVPSGRYKEAFETKNFDIIDAITSNLNKEDHNTVLMQPYDVQETTKLGDLSVIETMVQRNINLGECLTAVVRLITYAVDNKRLDNKLIIDYDYWYEVLSKIIEKDLPAKDVDDAMATALTNSKTRILSHLLVKMPIDTPQSKKAVQYLVNNKYMRDDKFKEAIYLNNEALVKLFMSCGMEVRRSHLQLAEKFNCTEALKAMNMES